MGAEDVIKVLEKKSGLTTTEIANTIGISSSAVKRIMRSLIKTADVVYKELTKEEIVEKYGKNLNNTRIRIYRINLDE